MHSNLKDNNGSWNDHTFMTIMKAYKNKVLSGKTPVAVRGVFHTNFHRGLIMKPNSMNQKSFKGFFEVQMNLSDDFKTD